MKCICGYEYLEDWELEDKYDEDSNFINGNEDFIKVDVKATVKSTNNWGMEYQRDVNIYACPKCGTLRMEEFLI